MSRATRQKGLLGEREVAALFRAAGLEVRALEGLGDQLVICPRGVILHSEVKRQERVQLPLWLQQAAAEAAAGTLPVVAFRQTHGEWYAALRLADLIAVAAR